MKKIILSFLTVFICQTLEADTYLFRVRVDNVRTAQTVRTFFNGRGDGDVQPFFATYVLTQPNTDYVLVKITPKDTDELKLARAKFNLTGIDLYQIYKLDPEYGVKISSDNSKQFPVNSNWADIQVSTP